MRKSFESFIFMDVIIIPCAIGEYLELKIDETLSKQLLDIK